MLVEVENLTKSFRNIEALKGINFTMDEGVYGLIGSNGAGKSTTIKILLDLIRPSSGTARIRGMDCQEESYEIKKKLGVLHENAQFPKR
ncbi:MAG: ATP-binding cassette domain-containing protein [Euryarchaeota archaeon]|nr:ATP-binding cassette domain-containing protein [Euryarchaeota archaeon]